MANVPEKYSISTRITIPIYDEVEKLLCKNFIQGLLLKSRNVVLILYLVYQFGSLKYKGEIRFRSLIMVNNRYRMILG